MQDYLQHLILLSKLQYQLNALELKLYSPEQHDSCFKRQAARSHAQDHLILQRNIGDLRRTDTAIGQPKSPNNETPPPNSNKVNKQKRATPESKESHPRKTTTNLIPIASNARRKRRARHTGIKAIQNKLDRRDSVQRQTGDKETNLEGKEQTNPAPNKKSVAQVNEGLFSVETNKKDHRSTNNQAEHHSTTKTMEPDSEAIEKRQRRTETLRPKPIHEVTEPSPGEKRETLRPKPIPEVIEAPSPETSPFPEPQPIPEVVEEASTESNPSLEPQPIPEIAEQPIDIIPQNPKPVPETADSINLDGLQGNGPVPALARQPIDVVLEEPEPVPEIPKLSIDEKETGAYTTGNIMTAIAELPVSVPSEAELLENFEGSDTLFLDDLSAMLSDIQDDPSELPSPLLLDPELDGLPEIFQSEPVNPSSQHHLKEMEDDQMFLESDEVMLQMVTGQSKNLHENIEALTDALDQMPENMSLWLARAKAWKRDGDLAAAISDCYRALQLSGEDLELLGLLEELLTDANIPQYRSILLSN